MKIVKEERKNGWTKIAEPDFDEAIVGIIRFKDGIVCATQKGVYMIEDDYEPKK